MAAFVYDTGFWLLINGLALWLIVLAARRGTGKRLIAPLGYVCGLVLIDGVARRFVLFHYGLRSSQYKSFYWLSDVALALGAFAVVCAFFYRACKEDAKTWGIVRLVLSFVFVLVLGISLSSLTRDAADVQGGLNANAFFFAFQQNLYFTCLVLNTLLYILMQQLEIADSELHLLVCGMGLQFAGPAANFALGSLTPFEFARKMYLFVGPLCTLGMILVWLYAIVRIPKPAQVRALGRLVPVLVRSQNAA